MIVRFSMGPAWFGLAALALFAVAEPAAAQAPAGKPSPQAVLIAKQIVEIKGVGAAFEPLVRGVVEKTKNMLMQTNFMWSKDLNETAVIVYNDVKARESELVDQTAQIYAGHFTEAELKQILAFYQSPLGQKMNAEEPKAVGEAMANAGNWGDNLSVDVVNKFRAEMKKRGHDL